MVTQTLSRLGPAPAVVFPLDDLPGLQAARILSARDVPVIGLARDPGHPYCRTTVCESVEAGDCDTLQGIEKLMVLGAHLGIKGVLFPCSDSTVLMVARHRERLARYYHVPPSDLETLEMLMDKTKFAEFCGRHGLLVPSTAIVKCKADADQAARELTFPCIVKPNVKSPDWYRQFVAKVVILESAGAWMDFYGRIPQSVDSLIVQEWIVGPEINLYSCNCYFDRQGNPVTSFVARKIRQWPPQIGVSSLGQEARNDHVRDVTLELFAVAGLRGLGYLEMKRDERDHRYFIIEANVGRPTGRSAIAEGGGVELLYAVYCDALGLPAPDQLTQGYGQVKWIHLLADLKSARHYWQRGELTLMDWWRSISGPKVYAVWSWRDPAPFLVEAKRAAFSFFRVKGPAPRRRPLPSAHGSGSNRAG
ncbi:MAG: carboxylate--amine ligase [Proteobacteria bacterium]|nr:carboxylate--amine ligase [Pseudomonadota bacterium]